MRGLQLDPASIAAWSAAAGVNLRAPSLLESIICGVIGGTIMSVAGFAPWALSGLWLHETIGEAGLYAVCALVFIGLSGPLLHRLVIGLASMWRWYQLFGAAFGSYAVAWTVGWMTLGGHKGSLIGLLVGAALMAWILTSAFGARAAIGRVFVVLFVSNAIGYFAGGWVESALSSTQTHPTVDKLMWGVCYGIGLGAGLGCAFYFCQHDVRRLLARRHD